MAQLASAPALGAGGPPFESEYPDKKVVRKSNLFLFHKLSLSIVRLNLVHSWANGKFGDSAKGQPTALDYCLYIIRNVQVTYNAKKIARNSPYDFGRGGHSG